MYDNFLALDRATTNAALEAALEEYNKVLFKTAVDNIPCKQRITEVEDIEVVYEESEYTPNKAKRRKTRKANRTHKRRKTENKELHNSRLSRLYNNGYGIKQKTKSLLAMNEMIEDLLSTEDFWSDDDLPQMPYYEARYEIYYDDRTINGYTYPQIIFYD